jgi:hypothetical protein
MKKEFAASLPVVHTLPSSDNRSTSKHQTHTDKMKATATATAETTLYAVRNGNEEWQEEVITSTNDAAKLAAARNWATANGFGRFREANFSLGDVAAFGRAAVRA